MADSALVGETHVVRLVCPICESQAVVPDESNPGSCASCGNLLSAGQPLGGEMKPDADEALLVELRDAFDVRPGEPGADDPERVEVLKRSHSRTESSLSRNALSPGSRLADFEIIREIGRGGMGIVYEARQLSLDRSVALKVLPFSDRHGRLATRRFRTEAHAAGKLNHTHVVPVYSQGEHEGHYFYAMKLVDGASLDAVIRTQPQLLSSTHVARAAPSAGNEELWDPTTPIAPAPEADAAEDDVRAAPQRTKEDYRFITSLMAGVADGLAHAHANGVIHRDIKPHNLILGEDRQLYITDFGLAYLESEPHVTVIGEVMGTPAYLSPEQARGDVNAIDRRTDIFSIGVTIYEMITGRLPFDGESRDQILHAVCHTEPSRPRQVNPNIPVDLETICLRSLEKEPVGRYATAAALADDLRRFSDGRPILSRRVGPVERAVKWARRHKAVTTAICAVFALVAVAVGGTISTLSARHRTAEQMRARSQDAVQSAYHQLVHIDYGDFVAALPDIELAESYAPDLGRLPFVRAVADIGAAKYSKAIEALGGIVERDPGDAEARYALAWAFWGADDFESSRRTFEEADALGAPEQPEAWFFRGRAAHRNDPTVAIESYRIAIQTRGREGGQFPQAELHLARAQNQEMYAGRTLEPFEEAERTLLQLIANEYYGAYPYYLLSITYRLAAEYFEGSTVGRGDELAPAYFTEALKYARMGQDLEPQHNRPVTAEAMCLQRMGLLEEALDARNRAIELSLRDDHRCEGYHYRWRLHDWLGHFDEALDDITRHLACVPEAPDAEMTRRALFYEYFYPALVHAEAGRMEEALTRARALGELSRVDAQATLLSAACLRILGQPEEAMEMLLDRMDEVDYSVGLVPSQSPAWAEALYAFAVGRAAYADLDTLAGATEMPWRLLGEADFHAGAKLLAAGDRKGAKERFSSAYRSFDGWVNYTFHGRMLEVKLNHDPNWPGWIPVGDDPED